VDLFENIMQHAGDAPLEKATADFVMIAFFFLLRVGEYTKPQRAKKTRTVQLRRRDIQFWKNSPDGNTVERISHMAPLNELLLAVSATITLDNQKNSMRGSKLHQDAVTHNPICPVRALARRFHASRLAAPDDPDALLCLYDNNKWVQARNIGHILHRAAFRTEIWKNGFDIKRIGPHSLRASGAMQLKLNGVDMALIKKLGRWSSDTWELYLHSQISCLTTGVSSLMATRVMYYNVATTSVT
jgi:hypothetical protein